MGLFGTGRYPEAEKLWAQAIKIREKLAERFPDQQQYQEGLIGNYRGLGQLYVNTGKTGEAEGFFRKSLALAKKILAEAPGAADNYDELATCHDADDRERRQ